ERIYIIKDDQDENEDNHDENTAIEFQTLFREMQYYLDYLNYDIWEMADILHPYNIESEGTARADSQREQSLKEKCASLRDRIRVYVTTTKILKTFAPQVLKPEVHSRMLSEIIRPPSIKDNLDFTEIVKLMIKLDYLFTKGKQGMIYNFLNQRADPSELKFD